MAIDPTARVTPPSPNAASLGKYGSFPVSNYTGTPSISIPIYELKGSGLSLPVSLSYHASGIRVDEAASDVGLGWSLNAGGVITRTVKGLPDDYSQGGLLVDNTIPAKLDYSSLASQQSNQNYLLRLANGNADGEPDEFNFNFNGHSGKFVIDRAKIVRVIPYQDIKIVPNFTAAGQIDSWTVTTADGMQYFFGETAASKDQTIPDASACSDDIFGQYTSGWYLTRMLDPNTQETVGLSYVTHNMSYLSGITQTQDFGLYEDNKLKNGNNSGYSQSCDCGLTPYDNNIKKAALTCPGSRTEIAAQLNEITSLFYKLKFNYDNQRLDLPGGVKLNSVDVVSLSTSGILKHITLSYGYFISNAATNNQPNADLTYRLKLLNVQETGGGISVPAYTFSYLETGAYQLPARLSYNQDHWGFSNGASNTTLLPTLYPSSKIPGLPGANRQPDPEYMKAGMLQQITFPTGGYTVFTYEPHYYDGQSPTTVYERVRSTEWEKYAKTPTTYNFACRYNSNLTQTQTVIISGDPKEALVSLNASNSYNPNDVTAQQRPERFMITGPTHNDIYGVPTNVYYDKPINNSSDSKWIHMEPGTYTMTLSVDPSVITNPVATASVSWQDQGALVTNPANGGVIAGGLRVKNISTYDGANPAPIVKTFSYQLFSDPTKSSGKLLSAVQYQYDITNITDCTPRNATSHLASYCGDVCMRLGLSSNSRLAMIASGGSAVVYPNVTVWEGANGENGKSEYSYSYVRDTFLYNMTTPVVQSQDWRRGLLLQSVDYQKSGSNYSAVKTVQNTYDMRLGQSVNNYLIDAMSLKWKQQSQPCTVTLWPNLVNYFNFGYYRIASFWYTLTSTTTMQDGVSSTTSYTYNAAGAHANPVQISTLGSDGRAYATKKYYAADLGAISTHPNFGDQATFLSKYMVGIPLQEEDYVGPDTAHLGAAKTASRVQYQNYNSAASNGQWLPYKSFLMSRDGSWVNKFTIDAYQPTGGAANNTVVLPSQFTKQGFPSTYLSWSNNLLNSTSFDVLTKTYTYWNDTKLLNTTTDEFGLTARFTYDGLQRLVKSEGLFADAALTTPKVVTASSYQYGAGTPINSVTSSATFYDPDQTRVLTNIGYIDGIGRSLEGVKVNYGQNYTHVQTGFTTYDAFGRPSQTYQPGFTGGSNYTTTPASPYFQTMQYEASPLGRSVKTVKEDGYSVGAAYDKNGANEVFFLSSGSTSAVSYGSPSGPGAASAGYFAAGTLYKTTTTDENNHQTVQYKDLFGRIVLMRKISSGGNIDTYYIYDDYGKLAAVAPPGSVDGSGSVNQAMLYQYNYDLKNRMAQKKIPNAGWQYFRYDLRDLMVLTQDANMRAASATKCMATLYDNIGRPVETGFSYTSLDGYADGNAILINDAGGDDLSHTVYYLANDAVGQRNKIYQTRLRVVGNPSGNDATSINKTYQYDVYGRAKYTSENTASGFTMLDTMTYLYSGKPTSVHRDLMGYWGLDWYSNDQITYDYSGRVMNASNQMLRSGGRSGNTFTWYVNVSQQTISGSPTYDAQDRITQKNIGLAANGNWLQSPAYQFNARGWLTKINDPASYNTSNTYYAWNTRLLTTTEPYVNSFHSSAQTAPDYAWSKNNPDLFDEDIHYYDTNPNIGPGQPQYNGNISYIVWKVAGREKQGYAYQYDDLDRLTGATYADMQDANYSAPYTAYTTDNKFGESASYDVRGNILTLKRRGLQQYGTNSSLAAGVFGPIDDLKYSYLDANNPDRLSGVADATGSAKGFAANWTGTSDYSYDANGNMYADRNKGLTIYYNHMNLPKTILNNNLGGRVDFLYDAAGNKLKKTVTDGSGNVTYKYYADGIEFDNMYYAPTTFYNGEGRLNYDANLNGWYYEYALKDHLGDTRVVFADKNGDGKIDPFSEVSQVNHFYPFGLNMEGNWNGAAGAYKKQYNGKEWTDDQGINLNDYGARWYDPALAKWLTIDPLAEVNRRWSPFVYAANNPLRFIDPTGMIWQDPQQATQLTKKIDDKIDDLKKAIKQNQDRLNNTEKPLTGDQAKTIKDAIKDNEDRIAELNHSKQDIEDLGNDKDRTYFLSGGNGDDGEHIKKVDDKTIAIEGGSDALYIHEIRHVARAIELNYFHFDDNTKEMRFQPNTSLHTEVSAYKAQYSYDPSTLRNAGTINKPQNISEVNLRYLGSLINTSTGEPLYQHIHDTYEKIKNLDKQK